MIITIVANVHEKLDATAVLCATSQQVILRNDVNCFRSYFIMLEVSQIYFFKVT